MDKVEFPGPNSAQVAMTLCALAYTDETPLPNETLPQQIARMRKDINAALTDPSLATANDWLIAWGPGLSKDRSTMFYVAKQRGQRNFAIVIRGTDWSFIADWAYDGMVIPVSNPWQVGTIQAHNKIALGSLYGVGILGMLTSDYYLVGDAEAGEEAAPTMTPINAWDFLQAQSRWRGQMDVTVTGHSLGGCLANLLSSMLDYDLNKEPLPITLYSQTFAAPTAGNETYAAYYQSRFGSRALRLHNSLDAVPHGWGGILQIPNLYLPMVTCPADYIIVIDTVADIVKDTKLDYRQPAPAQRLNGSVNMQWPNFCQQVAFQHSSQTYLSLLGAPQTETNGPFGVCPQPFERRRPISML